MRSLLFLLFLALPGTAPALTNPTHGPWIDLGAGATLDGARPPALGPGGTLSLGWFFGRYDDVFALGRYTGVGLTTRASLLRSEVDLVPSIEVRRGVDALVVGYHGFLTAGPALSPEGAATGLEALIGAGITYRFRAHLGLGVRLGGGVRAGGGDVVGRGVLRIVLAWAAPLGRRDEAP